MVRRARFQGQQAAGSKEARRVLQDHPKGRQAPFPGRQCCHRLEIPDLLGSASAVSSAGR